MEAIFKEILIRNFPESNKYEIESVSQVTRKEK